MFKPDVKGIVRLEVVSKPQIAFENKASHELQTERTRKYVSISTRAGQRRYQTLDGGLKPFLRIFRVLNPAAPAFNLTALFFGR